MSYSNLLKQLKKKLRIKKRWLSLGMFVCIAGSAAILLYAGDGDRHHHRADAGEALRAGAVIPVAAPSGGTPKNEALQSIATSRGERDVTLRKQFVCGEETQALGRMKAEDIIRYHEEFPTYGVTVAPDGSVTFTAAIDDLSPHCKQNAYIGIDKNGNLSLFEGVPAGDQVIRTFFQLNVQQLKSSLPHETWNQLYEGIRITDLAEFNSVLSTFSDYAIEGQRIDAPQV